jgi:deoxyribonuclease V
LACHLGVLLDVPSIGVAKSLLIGECKEPARRTGATSPLFDAQTGEQIGVAVRMANAAKPVYVSQGHRISLVRAVEFTLAVKSGFRIPRHARRRSLCECDLPPAQIARRLTIKKGGEN